MTKEQAKQRAEIMLAWANGETIQYRNRRENKWLDSDVNGRLEFNWLDFEYTIKPKMKTVPLEAGDVPPGSVFRRKGNAAIWQTALHLIKSDIFLSDSAWKTFDELLSEGWEILRPGSTTWEKCEKIVEEKGEV